MSTSRAKIIVESLSIHYGSIRALNRVSLRIFEREILAIIGPARSGKTSFLRTLNRLNDLEHNFRMEGRVLLNGKSIYDVIR